MSGRIGTGVVLDGPFSRVVVRYSHRMRNNGEHGLYHSLLLILTDKNITWIRKLIMIFFK